MKKALDANMATEEVFEHVNNCYDDCFESVMEATHKSIGEEGAKRFACAMLAIGEIEGSVIYKMLDRISRGFFMAGYYCRNQEALKELTNDGEG